MTLRALAAALLAAAGAWACGGGGGGGGGPTAPPAATPTPTPSQITFTPSDTGGVNSLALTQGGGTTAESLVLTLEATEVSDLYGVAFDLLYPEDLLRADSITEGTFLADGGADTSLQQAENPPGTLIVGLSRLGQVGGRSGSGTLLTVRFSRVAAGSGTLRFENNGAQDSRGDSLNAQWSAGSVQVP